MSKKILYIALLSTAFSACEQEDIPLTAPARARVLMVHAAPSVVRNVELYTADIPYSNDNRRANLAFAATAAVSPSAGTRPLRLRLIGDAKDALRSDPVLDDNAHYTALIANTDAARTDTSAPVGVLMLRDDLNAPAGDAAKVRIIHLGVGVPAVDIYITLRGVMNDTLPDIVNKSYLQTFPGNSALPITAGAFGQATPLAFAELPVGTYTVAVRPTGASHRTTPVLTTEIVLAKGRAYTVLARGYLTPPTTGPTSSRRVALQLITHDPPVF
jgi:Domain of unknown function (DUF4397)